MKNPPSSHQPDLFLEALEDRIAPAGLVSFTDSDGDVVQVKTSKGTNSDLQNALNISEGGQLLGVDLSNAKVFAGTSLDIVVKTKGANGDGFVNVGLIDAHGVDIGAVNVKGDVGKIVAGDDNLTTAGLKSLAVHSLGAKGTSTQVEGDIDLKSTIFGSTSSVKVDTSIVDASINWLGDIKKANGSNSVSIGSITVGKDINGGSIGVDGTVTTFTVGGSIIGGGKSGAGSVYLDSVNTVKIGGSIIGGDGINSGSFHTNALRGALTVGGTITGSEGDASGQLDIAGNSSASISVRGNVVGGSGDFSGQVDLTGRFTTVAIGGSLLGGSGEESGSILSKSIRTLDSKDSGGIATLSIAGGIYGGTGTASANVTANIVGTFSVGGNISATPKYSPSFNTFDLPEATDVAVVHLGQATSVSVGGSISGNVLEGSGRLVVDGGLQSLAIKGSLLGGAGDGSGSVSVSTSTALKTTIGGSVLGSDGEGSGSLALLGSGLHSVAIGGRIQGGAGDGSAAIDAINGNVSSFTVGGSVLGGTGDGSASIDLAGDFGLGRMPIPIPSTILAKFAIGGSVVGSEGEGSAAITLGTVTTATIGGNLVGGEGSSSARIEAYSIGTLDIGGNVQGGSGDSSASVRYFTGTSIHVGGDVTGGKGDSSAALLLGATTAKIDGSVIGGGGEHSGSLGLANKIKLPVKEEGKGKGNQVVLGSVNIGGDIVGGGDSAAGSVYIEGSGVTFAVTVGGDIIGGTAEDTGLLALNAPLSSLVIGGSVVGGVAEHSGTIDINTSGTVGLVSIAGSLIGGQASTDSGTLFADGATITSLFIGGDVVGGSGNTSPTFDEPEPVTNSGAIIAKAIGTLTVEGSLIAGQPGSKSDLNLGAIRVGSTLGTLNVLGSIAGNSDNSFLITARGLEPTALLKTNVAINAINVSGDVSYAEILAGYNTSGTTIGGDGGTDGGTASIGAVRVSGDWTASSIAAGVNTGESGQWGTDSNHLLGKGSSSLVASIASIVIDGIASGSDSTQHGFVSQKIGSLSAGGFTYAIPANPGYVQVGPDASLVARLAITDDNANGNNEGGGIV